MKKTDWLGQVRGRQVPKARRNLAMAFALISLVGGAALIFRARASNSPPSNRATATISAATTQGMGRSRVALNNRLAFQPRADHLRQRLGQRFRSAGREVSTLVGTLTINGQSSPIAIVRRQDDDGERVSIRLGGGPQLTWNGADGARSDGRAADVGEHRLIERIALDSPDQFILAQLRGASYYTVATKVVPEEALESHNYNGPAWDVVRVKELDRAGLASPESPWRMYYINSETGLIERIISSEQGEPILAELLEWSNHQGELMPGRIRWTRNKQVIMELVFSGVAYGAR